MLTIQDKLVAVNEMLDNLGEAPVNTLTGSIPLDASKALNTLDEVSREVQKKGWYFNTEYRSLPIDQSGHIQLPLNTLQVRTVDCDRDLPVVQRGTKLYNMTPFEHGFVFDNAVQTQIILGLDFDELPQTARSYIAIRAARVFQIRQLGDEMNAREDSEDEKRALTELAQEQTRMAPYSLKDNGAISAAIYGRPVRLVT